MPRLSTSTGQTRREGRARKAKQNILYPPRPGLIRVCIIRTMNLYGKIKRLSD